MTRLPLHITVATNSIPEEGNPRLLANDLRITKAALLYADEVELCSGAASLIVNTHKISQTDLPTVEKAVIFRTFLGFFGSQGMKVDSNFGVHLEHYFKVMRKKPRWRTNTDLRFVRDFDRAMRRVWPSLQVALAEKSFENGLDEMRLAISRGLLKIHELETSALSTFTEYDQIAKEFVESVQQTLLAKHTYPLFDETTTHLVRSGLAAGILEAEPKTADKSKQAGLVGELFEHIPALDLPMDELLHVREELSKPLIRFRSEIISLGDQIDGASWDEDFHQDVEALARRKIDPALLEIEELLQSASLVNFWTRRMSEKFTTVAAMLAAASAIGLKYGSAAGIATLVAEAAAFVQAGRLERREELGEIHRAGMYFYYRLSRK